MQREFFGQENEFQNFGNRTDYQRDLQQADEVQRMPCSSESYLELLKLN